MQCIRCRKELEKWGNLSEDGYIFSYGLGGTFKLKTKLSFDVENPVDRKLCGDCINEIGYEAHYDVECKLCYSKYQRWFYEHEGGYGCDADIYKRSRNDNKNLYDWYISGNFGSKYDMRPLRFIKLPGDLKESDIVCDICIDNFCKNGICVPMDKYTNTN